MTGPNQWVDEGPRTPYSPTISYSGSMALPLTGKLKQIRIVTPAEQERQDRAHEAHRERQRRARLLTARQIAYLAAVERHGGNRTYAARELHVTVASVQCAMRRVRAAGVPVPRGSGRGPDLRQRKRAA